MQEMEGVHKCAPGQLIQQVTLFLFPFSVQRLHSEVVGPFKNFISFTLGGI